MRIIDGYTGEPNIYADDIGQYNISLFGSGDYVLPVGEQLGYELVSNNEIRIKDGLFITQGRRGIIKKGTTESCIIENGTQAENRNDLIVIEYAKNEVSLVESHTLKVIKGTPGEDATDPEVVTGDIPNGAVLHQMPLYRVKLEGLNVVAVEPLFSIGKIAPETVDPMAATEEGFAADAALTGKALQEIIANFTTAANGIGDAIAAKGVDVPVGTSLLEMAAIITNNLYKPPTSKTGSFYVSSITSKATMNKNITFGVVFENVPNVTVGTNSSYATASVKSVTKAGAVIAIYNPASSTVSDFTVSWTAVD